MSNLFSVDSYAKIYKNSPILVHRLKREQIQSSLKLNADQDEDVMPAEYTQEVLSPKFSSNVRYILWDEGKRLIPVSTHPRAQDHRPQLEFLFKHSKTSAAAMSLQVPPSPKELQQVEHRLLKGHPVQLTNVPSVYESGFFQLPSAMLSLRSSKFHKMYPSNTPIFVNDAFQPDFQAQRSKFATTLEVLTGGMDDQYACLQTIDSEGMPTFGMTPDWFPWITGVSALLQEHPNFQTIPSDLSHLREHLSIRQPICFSGLLVDPHGLCHYNLVQSGVQYVFWLSGSTNLGEERFKECVNGEGVQGMQYDSTIPDPKSIPLNPQRTWNVMRMTPGDAMIFPPGTIRIYYSIGATFSISGSFLSRSLLHLTSQQYFRKYNVYPRHLRSFRHLVLCMVWSIHNQMESEKPLSFQDLETLPVFLQVAETVIMEEEEVDEDEAKDSYSSTGGNLDMRDLRDCVRVIRAALSAIEAALPSAGLA